jgi:proteasome assembly chaperone (PAC2) family protein
MADSVSELTWYDLPELRRPLLLVAFEGMFDAAEAATGALDWIRERADAAAIGMIDPEYYYNFQEARPMVRIAEDGSRVIDWPSTEIWSATTSSARDLVVMSGVEPHLRWPSFAEHVLEVARRSRCEMVVTVGAFIGMVPHTRPFTVTGSAVHPDLARRLNLSQPTYQGPTGVVGVINARLEESSVPVISLRVEVPHYVPGAPNPKATQALLRRLEQTTGVETGYEDLDAQVSDWVSRVDRAVAADEESRDYVSRLERQVDSTEELLPTGDDLAAELEAFLRDQQSIRDAVEENVGEGSEEATSEDAGDTSDDADDRAGDDADDRSGDDADDRAGDADSEDADGE